MSYPSVSAYFQHHPISHHLQHLWKNKRKEFFIAVFQYVALFTMIIIALVIDWRKTILYIIIPQQFALVTVLVFNYIQHVHADEESKFNHSRNFVSGFTNFMLFNNGFHTVHHYRASIHWSKLPEEHKKINHLIEPHLNEQVILVYLFKTYIMAPFHKSFRASSMRVARKKKELITAR
ncbi:MAG: fatty acid desaturase [Ferruginibacter sp.]